MLAFLAGGSTRTNNCFARYLVHPAEVTYDQLRLAQSPLAQDRCWGSKLRRAAEATLQIAKNEEVCYAELGGWAIAEHYRNTKAALETLLALYLWAETIGHCLCSCMATVQDRSSSILRRMGAGALMDGGEPFPSYFDLQYGCTMEMLGFDSRQAPTRFAALLDEMRPKLAQFAILQPSHDQSSSFLLTPLAYPLLFRPGQPNLQARAKQSVPHKQVSP